MRFYVPTAERGQAAIKRAPALGGIKDSQVLLLSNGKACGHKVLNYFGSLLAEHEPSAATEFWNKRTFTMPADSKKVDQYALEVDAVVTAIGD
ncbi:MAG TPA: hypothetical protein VKB84_11680 [Candidatus Binataceae bacterium]|jgi:hypothetical protein|nr:hypothetical protein [Candidatus Binataceae bacterium]